jgi:FdhD protein
LKQIESKNIWRWQRGGSPSQDIDRLANEEPLEIRVNGEPVSVTMRTPGEDAELAAGFLWTEGLVKSASDVRSTKPIGEGPVCNVIDVELAPHVSVDLMQLTRHVFASSSCGVCGKTTIESVHRQFEPVEACFEVAAEMLLSLPDRFRSSQATFDRTGGLHAAAVFDERGDLVILREDVGRHNAVDKAIGYGILNRLVPFDRHILMVSGRSSFEIMQKALAARIPVVVAVSAPSSLAVQFAEQSNQTLVGFLRGDKMNVYSQRQRIRF